MSSENKKRVMDLGDFEDLVSHITIKAILFLIALLIAAVVQAARHGLTTHDIILMVGSVLSGVAMFLYGIQVMAPRGERRALWALFTLGGFIPYLFGCYLVFYEGFWRLRQLSQGISLWVILLALCFIIGGYLVVWAMYKLTVLEGHVKSGAIVLQKP